MNKKFFKGFFTGALTMVLIFGLALTAAAQTNYLQAISADNLKLYVNLSKVTPTDASGNTAPILSYNSTTYLPIRAVANAIGLDVSYDKNTSSIYLGTQPNAQNKVVTLDDFTNKTTDVKAEYIGTSYNSAFVYTMDEGLLKDENGYTPTLGLYSAHYQCSGNDAYTDPSWSSRIELSNLNGLKTFTAKYKTFKGDLSSDHIVTRLIAVDQNNKLLFEKTIKSLNTYEDIKFDITGATKVSIRVTTTMDSWISASGVLADLKLE